MSNAVTKVIPFTILYVVLIVLLTNYMLLGPLKIIEFIPNFFLYIIYAIIFYFIFGYSISVYASKKQCNKSKKIVAMKQGFKSIILPIIVYIVIYFIPAVRKPFNELFGDNILGNSIAEITLISLNLITVTIMNYFDSVKESCKVSNKELEERIDKLDKYLNKKTKKKKKKMIEVRD